jgi:hypothetical protein
MMIDNVEVRIADADAPDFFLETIPFDSKKDRHPNMRHCGNMQITKSPSGISIKGSLAKYRNGENQTPLKWGQIPETLDDLGKKIGISLSKAKVYSLETGITISVEQQVSRYLMLFGFSRLPFKRVEYSTKDGLETIQYRTKTGRDFFHAYNKALEMRKTSRIDDAPVNNLLRLEYRIYKHRGIKDIFDGDISPYDLAKPKVRLILDYRFNRFYKSIEKAGRQLYLSDIEKLTPKKITAICAQLSREEDPKK